MLHVDNNYWRRIQDEKNKQKLVQTLQNHFSRTTRAESAKLFISPDKQIHLNPLEKGKERYLTLLSPSNSEPLWNSILRPNGWLMAAKWQCQLNLGLCIYCSQTKHLAKTCPKQGSKQQTMLEGQTMQLEGSLGELEEQKNNLAAHLFPRGLTAWVNPRKRNCHKLHLDHNSGNTWLILTI